MLPASKRPARFYEPTPKERQSSAPAAAAAAAPSRKKVAVPARAAGVVDDDPTLLFSGSLPSILPPRPDKPVSQPPIAKAPPLPNLRGGLRGPHRSGSESGSGAPRLDDEDRTILRPVPGDLLPRRTPIPPAAPSAPPPKAAPDRRAARDSDAGDPPSTVNTARLRVVRVASRQSATAALVAVGALAGLVVAMIARGDANGVLDATAGLIDPSHAAGASALPAPIRFTVQPQQPLDTAPKPMPAGTEASNNAGACSAVSEPVSPTVAPIVISATSHAAGAAPPKATPVEPSPTPRVGAPAVAAAPPAHASAKQGGSSGASAHEAGGSPSHAAKTAKSAPADYESAVAADALAKAQLEASLR